MYPAQFSLPCQKDIKTSCFINLSLPLKDYREKRITVRESRLSGRPILVGRCYLYGANCFILEADNENHRAEKEKM